MFDINTAIGHWPFRRIPHQSAGDLRRHLEGYGITGAAAANTHGLFYKNSHDANLELAEAIEPHRAFFVGVATLNPTYAAWERDLDACAGELGMRALRLVPQYHGYALQDGAAVDLARAATAKGLPLLIPHRVVDVRQRHWLDTETVTALADVLSLCRAVPEARVLFTEYAFSLGAVVGQDGKPISPGLYVETSRTPSAYGQTLAAVVHAVGADRVLFGSGAPFKEVSPALLRLQHADLSESERTMVTGTAARRLLGLDRP